jgi:CspA family cold shock protein
VALPGRVPLLVAGSSPRGEAFQIQIRYTYMQKGKLKFFDTSRGFGFIEPLDGSEDVFLHANNISGMTSGEDLREGQTIEYETEQTEKGLSALNAAPADEKGAL